MNRVEVSEFTSKDLAFGKILTDLEKWHRTAADWSRLMKIEPSGMLKARLDGRDVSIAGVLSYEGVSWIHSMIVLPEPRRRGIGRTLMQACIAVARDFGNRCIKLDSVHGFEDFYVSLGFAKEFESHGFLGNGASYPRRAEEMRSSDLSSIVSFDEAVIDLDRGRVLRAIFKDNPRLAFLTASKRGISGYVLAREGEERVQIGPCVVEKGDFWTARRLITTVLGSLNHERRFRMCVPGANEGAVRLAQGLGFVSGTSSTRMSMGESFQESVGAFAMISPEKG